MTQFTSSSLHIGKFMLDIVQRRMLFSRGRGRLWGRNLTKSFFAYSQNIYTPENFIVPFFHKKVSIVMVIKVCCIVSPLPNAKRKISNIWWLVSPTTTVWLKTVVKWPRLLRFSSKMTLVYARIYWVLETLRLRFFGISREPRRSGRHVTRVLPSGLRFEVHVCMARPRSRNKWFTARFFAPQHITIPRLTRNTTF